MHYTTSPKSHILLEQCLRKDLLVHACAPDAKACLPLQVFYATCNAVLGLFRQTDSLRYVGLCFARPSFRSRKHYMISAPKCTRRNITDSNRMTEDQWKLNEKRKAEEVAADMFRVRKDRCTPRTACSNHQTHIPLCGKPDGRSYRASSHHMRCRAGAEGFF